MKRRELMDLLGDEPPSCERIRFVCQTPGNDVRPWLQLPRTFRLDDPTTYFTTDIQVRHRNMLTRSNWAMAFSSPSARGPHRKSGAEEESLKTGAEPSKMLGAILPRAENGRSMDHRPKSPGGRFICWDHSCWRGCARTACPHSHKKS